MAGVIAVAAIDNDRMLLDGLRQWLAAAPGIRLAAAATTVEEFVRRAPAAGPVDVVLLDLILGDGSAPLANLARLAGAGHRVLVVSVCSTPARMESLFTAHGVAIVGNAVHRRRRAAATRR